MHYSVFYYHLIVLFHRNFQNERDISVCLWYNTDELFLMFGGNLV